MTTPAMNEDTMRAVIEEAAQVLESAAAHNRSKGRTVLERTQQDRADRLRAVAAHLPKQVEAMRCAGCEGKPSAENSPCAVCGKVQQVDAGSVRLDAAPLRNVLQALMGPQHHVMELWATQSLPDSDVAKLVQQFNASVAPDAAQQEQRHE